MSKVDPGYSLIANWIYRNSRVAYNKPSSPCSSANLHSRWNYFCNNVVSVVVVVVVDDLPSPAPRRAPRQCCQQQKFFRCQQSSRCDAPHEHTELRCCTQNATRARARACETTVLNGVFRMKKKKGKKTNHNGKKRKNAQCPTHSAKFTQSEWTKIPRSARVLIASSMFHFAG